jgi:ubiquinone/menaquinone biosynthesis C-methylase UbiE
LINATEKAHQVPAGVLAERSLLTHGAFLLPLLRRGMSVLDCGCGPGSITCDVAQNVAPGTVVGIDSSALQIERASTLAATRGIKNITFRTASVYDLPFGPETFELVFAHALFQHLGDPKRALSEIWRTLKPGGVVAIRSPDWGALFVAPRTPSVMTAIQRFLDIYYANGDAFAGSNARMHLLDAGFREVDFSASVEPEAAGPLAEFAACRLEAAGCSTHAAEFRLWAENPYALFAQGWGSVIGRKPA